jgi:hypothetical protein
MIFLFEIISQIPKMSVHVLLFIGLEKYTRKNYVIMFIGFQLFYLPIISTTAAVGRKEIKNKCAQFPIICRIIQAEAGVYPTASRIK